MNALKQFSVALSLMAVILLPVHASDTAKEKRWADQIVDFLIEGEPHSLEADGQKFLAIYTPAATDNPAGAVILIHGMGVHPDWPQVINPLRTQLPEKGWATLSLQMPILPNGKIEKDYVIVFVEASGRIKAGIDFLEKQGIKPVVLVGHSLGATMAANFLATVGDSRVKAFTGIGMKSNRPEPELNNIISLTQIQLPVLDIYGSNSVEHIVNSAPHRADVMTKTGHSSSRQVRIEGANHFYKGHEDQLLATITTWLALTTGDGGHENIGLISDTQ